MRSAQRLACAAFALVVSSLSGVAAQSPTNYTMTLSSAQVSNPSPTRTVVTMAASGDLRGMLTLTIDRQADGSLGGEWAFVVRYEQEVDEGGNPAHGSADETEHQAHHRSSVHDEAEPHHERFVVVNKGTIGGTITGGKLTEDAHGALTAISTLQLTLQSGSVSFEGVSGGGWSSGSSLDSAPSSSGTLSLTF